MATESLFHDLNVAANNQLLEALVESEARIRRRINLLTEIVFELDADGHIVFLNSAWDTLMGSPSSSVIGQTLEQHIHPEDRSAFDATLKKTRLAHETTRAVLRFLHDSGSTLWTELSMVQFESGYVGALHDITERKRYQDKLEFIAHYDVLTTMPNRILLADRLQQAMASAQRHGEALALAYLDLDRFKAINDEHGHEVGDQLLMALAARMKRALREGDTLARLGGDEFVVLLMDLADAQASAPILTRLLEAISQPVRVGELILEVSASIGVTFYPQTEDIDADQLLRQADQAMYQAKLFGKNRYHVFNLEQDRAARGRHETIDRIALAHTEREFVLHYQPMVNMRTGAVIGAEALIRWQHPDKGLLPPAEFLPVIENHPLAVEIGKWVIDTTLTQIEVWHAAGLRIPVSVNVSALQLQRDDFVAWLRGAMDAHLNLRRGDLKLEVLETSALEDLIHVSDVIKKCRAIGVEFALDDFGTGYSSLTYLKSLPVTQLKIDHSFVAGTLGDPDNDAILGAVLNLATALHRQPIAEGVETIEQGVSLLHLGCELAQGYGIARPMPGPAIPAWVSAWKPYPAWLHHPVISRRPDDNAHAAVQ